jgi:xylulokinase
VFAGLSLATGRADLARAVLEGVALELGWLNRVMGTVGPTGELRLTGGGSRSAVWSQILADVVRMPVARVVDPNPGLRGAAAYAWAGLHPGSSVLDWARDHRTPVEILDPDPARAAVYEESAGTYAALRSALHDAGLDERLGSSSSA